MGRVRAVRTALAWSVGLGGAGWLILWSGDIAWLRVEWSDPMGWLARSGVETAVAALARVAALAIVVWIAVSTLIYLLATVAGFRPSAIDWLSIGPLRRAVDTLAAGSLLLSTLAPSPALATEADPGYVPAPAGQEAEFVAEEPPATDVAAEGETETQRENAATAEPGSRSESVTVVAGDHLWGLAATRLARDMGRQPGNADIAPYWAAVVEQNRGRIRSGNPDLIYPGEEILLPPVNPGS